MTVLAVKQINSYWNLNSSEVVVFDISRSHIYDRWSNVCL